MKKILLLLYKLMFVFIPIPLFFDFGNFRFFILSVDDFNYISNNPKIPMPIGAIALFFAMMIGYICSVVYSNFFRSVFTPTKMLLFYFMVVTPLSIYGFFIAGLSFPRLVQLLLPIVFVSFFSFPAMFKDRLDIFLGVFISGFVFFSLHFLSIFFNSNDLLSINQLYEFSGFFNIVIYQSLVTYPAVLSVYFILTIALIYVARKNTELGFEKYSFLYYCFLFILLYLLAASGRRAFLVEYLSWFLIVLVFSLVNVTFVRVVKKKTILFLFLFLFLLVSFFALYVNTPLFQRVLLSINNNTFDSGRVNILSNAFDFFYNNITVLLFGGGARDVPGFHNFFLDQVYRIGLFGLLSVYITMGFLIRKFVNVNDIGTNYKYIRRVFLSMLFGSFFLQSMINASVSQPYYLINFLVVSVVIYFVLFSKTRASCH